ncbi:hypothetical protein OIO90_000294 [Microbotryomycetes sp. JL221]|nr:hypothetical protein OIO90_000294 [Microbotryomycetes sp. JL221]
MSSAPHSGLPSVSASRYLHQAPQTVHDAFTRDQIRQLVLEYMTSSCYADSAKAFAREVDLLTQTSSETANGDTSSDEPSVGRSNGFNDDATLRESANTSQGDAMEGVEATPEPELAAYLGTGDGGELDQSMMDEDGLSRVKKGSNGKNVAFRIEKVYVDGMDDDDDDSDVSYSMLSRQQLVDVRIRRDIRDDILNGRISQAVDLLDEHFPSVLKEELSSTASNPSSLSCSPSNFFVVMPPSNRPSPKDIVSPKAAVPILGASFGPWSLSLAPQILALNLQLQSFVELMRSAYVTPSTPSTPTRHHFHQNNNSSNGLSDSLHSEAAMSASTSSIGSLSGSHSIFNIAIAQSQALSAKVRQLPLGKDKENWEQECIDVSGLMAYKDLSTCPVRGYLSQERRETLADLVNAAILQRTGRTPVPILSLAVRQATALWSTLAEFRLPFPPSVQSNTNAKDNGKGKNKTVPRFDLRTFLSESDPRPPSTSNGHASGAATPSVPPHAT